MATAPVRFLCKLVGVATLAVFASCASYPDQLEQQINQYKQLPGPNKAFAVGFLPDGKWMAGWSFSHSTMDGARAAAIQGCEEKAAVNGQYLSCRVMYENATFVKAPAPVAATPPAPARVVPPAPPPVAAAVAAPAPTPQHAPAPAYSGSGSGVFVSSDGLVLTAEHVIDGAKSIEVQTRDGRITTARVIAISRNMDLAILSTGLSAPSNFPVRLIRPNPGDRVFTVGYPVLRMLGQEPKISDGIINSATGWFNESGVMQISIPIQPGNSGGPVLTEDGQLVGIVTSSAALETFVKASGSLPQNVNWAMHSSLAVTLLGKDSPAGPKLTRDKAIERAIQASVLVLVRN